MNVPRRILDGGSGDWERKVLESAAGDAPTPEFRRRVARELGVLTSIAALTSTTAVSGQALGVIGLVKLIGTGALLGLATVGVTYLANGPSTDSINRPQAPTVQAPSSKPVASEAPRSRLDIVAPSPPAPVPAPLREAPVTVGPPLVAPSSVPSAKSAKRAPSRRGDAPQTSVVPPTSQLSSRAVMAETDSALSEELRTIERARSALAAGDATAALSELDRYETTSGPRLFLVEAQVLRIEALAKRGDDSGARILARKFLAEHPESPYVRRVRTLVGENP
jgi:hypothetical protein